MELLDVFPTQAAVVRVLSRRFANVWAVSTGLALRFQVAGLRNVDGVAPGTNVFGTAEEPRLFYKLCCALGISFHYSVWTIWSARRLLPRPSPTPWQVQKLTGLLQYEGELPAMMSPEDFRDTTADATGVKLTDQELITVLR